LLVMTGPAQDRGAPGTVAGRALSIAFNDECDALVATVVAPPSEGPIEQNALSLLNSERIISAVRKALGL
jgi:hypothetical protein